MLLLGSNSTICGIDGTLFITTVCSLRSIVGVTTCETPSTYGLDLDRHAEGQTVAVLLSNVKRERLRRGVVPVANDVVRVGRSIEPFVLEPRKIGSERLCRSPRSIDASRRSYLRRRASSRAWALKNRVSPNSCRSMCKRLCRDVRGRSCRTARAHRCRRSRRSGESSELRFGKIGLLSLIAIVLERRFTLILLAPQLVVIRREPFVDPSVRPIGHGDVVAEPMLGEFVRNKNVAGILRFLARRMQRRVVRIVADEFSMPPNVKRSAVIWSYFSKGYFTPMICWRYATISLVRPKQSAFRFACGGCTNESTSSAPLPYRRTSPSLLGRASYDVSRAVPRQMR